MPEKEVCSPINRPGSKVGSNPPLSPGARSMPGAVSSDSIPAQPVHGSQGVRSHSEPNGGQIKVNGPDE